MKRKVYSAIVLLLLFAMLSHAATLKGTIFDASLKPVRAIVTVNTTPLQAMVSQNGSYEFEVPTGTFELTAKAENDSISEKVNIVSGGIFNLDLVLFGFQDPNVEVPSIAPNTGFENQSAGVGEPQQTRFPFEFATVILLGVMALAFVWHEWKKTGREMEEKTKDAAEPRGEKPSAAPARMGRNEFQKRILDEIRKSEGRITQRELRKLLPYSEAKVSIELDLLEEKGLIKKFKKGRGNVIILAEKGGRKQ